MDENKQARSDTGKPPRFQDTRWSLVAAARRDSAGDPRGALVELCLRYWYPVYSYARHSGHEPQAAQRVARAFFDDLVERQLADYDAPAGAQFRDFLLAALNRFLAYDRLHEAGNPVHGTLVPPAPLEELESRHRAHAVAAATPENAYQRGYALSLMQLAMERLRREAQLAGRETMFEALVPFLTQEARPGEYEEVARVLGLRPLTVVMAAKRLRQRFRELVEDELVETVGSAEALEAERAALLRALAL